MLDTISAICTAPGEGAVGIIRISGVDSLNIAKKIFFPKNNKSSYQPNQMIYGHIKDTEDNLIDEVFCVYMQAPKSYTAEDVVEIHCHGSKASLQKILLLTYLYGAKSAEPGEFTKRAFLNGRIDLTQAEAVMSIIKAKSETALKQAIYQQQGLLSNEVSLFRKKLKDLIVNLEVTIDYPEEDLEDVTNKQVITTINEILNSIQQLLENADTGRIIKEGLRTVIIGKPNVGKSSLLNALAGLDRAIVTNIPGTTRDSIEEQIFVEGIALLLIDTAGIRESKSEVEKIGIEKSHALLNDADLVLLLLDGSKPLNKNDINLLKTVVNKKHLVLINKTDLPNKINKSELLDEGYLPEDIINISVLKKIGWQDFSERLKQKVYGESGNLGEGIYVQEVRHKDLLVKAETNLVEALYSAQNMMPADCYLIDIKSALHNLGLITGETVNDEIVKEIFDRFCLGK